MNSDQAEPLAHAPAGESESGAGVSDTTGVFAQAKQAVATTARETNARIKSAASTAASRAKDTAGRVASDAKQTAAEKIGSYGATMHNSARSFEEQDPNIAWATHSVADRLERFAGYIRDSDLDELRADAETVARRHPVAFFGGLLLAGLVVGNLLKARPLAEDEEGGEEEPPEALDYDRGNASGTDASMEPPAPAGP